MKTYHLSHTYKILYDHIIHELLFQICSRDSRYCIANEEIPFLIGEKFEEYKARALKNMSGTRLDRHKLASCICGAIIEIKPLRGFKNAAISKNANEILAFYVGLNVIKFYMMYSAIYDLKITLELKEKIVRYLRENFSMQLPKSQENICDIQSYETNLINSLYWTHQHCNITNKECFQYDIWAYAKIFYHLELHNRAVFESCFQKCMENFH